MTDRAEFIEWHDEAEASDSSEAQYQDQARGESADVPTDQPEDLERAAGDPTEVAPGVDLAAELDRLDKAATPGWEEGDGWIYTMPVYPDDNRLANILGVKYADHDRQKAERERAAANIRLAVWLRNHTDEIKAALQATTINGWFKHVDKLKAAEAERDRLRASLATNEDQRERLREALEETTADRNRLRATLARVQDLPESWDDLVDWSPGRSNYGDNDAYTECARTLRTALAGDGTKGGS